MSITKRIIESARTSLNSLLDVVAPGSDAEALAIDVEIERRARARGGRVPAVDNPLARSAGASATARRERERMAATREERIRGARSRRAAAEARAREEEFRRTKARAQQGSAGPRPGGAGPRAGPRASGGGWAGGKVDAKVARHYKTLDLPVGSDFAAVKASYRKLMRKYHPDLHGQSAEKQRAATELTKQITQAYNELEAHLMGGPNRG